LLWPAVRKSKIGKRSRVHDLRHTAVSPAIKAQAHPKEIQARAGHSSIVVTMDVYGHLFPGQDKKPAGRHTELWWPDGGLEAEDEIASIAEHGEKKASDLDK
jgi:integrase